MAVKGVGGVYNNTVSAPVIRTIVNSGLSFTPTDDITVMLGGDVVMTKDGVGMPLLQGASFVLLEDETYVFSISTPLAIS